ncbi:hypothetical protein SRIMM317S_02861 [Streptomyces rimosus subsp. rimosus]
MACSTGICAAKQAAATAHRTATATGVATKPSPAANRALARNAMTMVRVRPSRSVRWWVCSGSRMNTTNPGAKTMAISLGVSPRSPCRRSSRSIHSPASAAAVTADTTIRGKSRRRVLRSRSASSVSSVSSSAASGAVSRLPVPLSNAAVAHTQAAQPSQNSSG